MGNKTALIAGATGLVGKELLQELLKSEHYRKVVALVRRPLEVNHSKLVEVVCDFDRLTEVESHLAVDDVFCALGTTIKKAKTKDAMVRIDVEYPLAIAELAKAQGARHLLIISSMNADPSSSFFYPRMKGELEEKLKKIPYESMSIFQPSLLLGNRDEFRLFERLGIGLFRGLSPFLSTQRRSKMGIEAKTVAAAMVVVALEKRKGVQTYTAEQMAKLSLHTT